MPSFAIFSHQDWHGCTKHISEEDGRHDDDEPDQGPDHEKEEIMVLPDVGRTRFQSQSCNEEADEHQDKLEHLEKPSGRPQDRGVHGDGHSNSHSYFNFPDFRSRFFFVFVLLLRLLKIKFDWTPCSRIIAPPAPPDIRLPPESPSDQ